MGLETVYVVIEIGTCGDSLPITKPDRLRDHLLAALSKFEAEEYAKGEPHIWEAEKILYGYEHDFWRDRGFGMNEVPMEPLTLYSLRDELEKDYANLRNEGGQNELVGEIGLD